MTTSVLENKNSVSMEEDMRQFLREIGSFPLLNAQQELDIAKGCAEGDENAIRMMVHSNLRLVVSIAREYMGRGIPLTDLIQEGSIGLLVAARKFDYTMDCRFSTYATKWIRQSIGRYLLNHAGLIRVPRQTMEKMRKLLAIKAALLQECGQEPTEEEIAQKADMPIEKVKELLELVPQICSLDAPAGEEEENSLQQLLEDVLAPQPYEELVRSELEHSMDQLLQTLNERQRQVLKLRFGMEDGICHPYSRIGEILEISKERARQIGQQALDKLQRNSQGLGLEEFLE